MNNREITSDRILAIMKEKEISYRELSELTDITKSTLQRYVANLSSKIPVDNIVKIANALHVSELYLMGLSDEKIRKEIDKKDVPFGLNDEIEEYLMNKDRSDLYELYKNVSESDSLRILMDSASDLTPQDLEPVLILIQGIRKAKGLD